MYRHSLTICGIMAAMASASLAGSIILPTRYTETTWTVSTLTGATWNECTKDKNVQTKLEITKTDSGIEFSGGAEGPVDVSDDKAVLVPLERRDEMVKALRDVAVRLRDTKPIKEFGKTRLFAHGGSDADHLTIEYVAAEKQKPYAELSLSGRCYLIRSHMDATKLAGLIAAVK